MLSTLVKLLAESNSGEAAAEQEESQGAPDAVPGLLVALLSACPPLQPLAADTEAVPRLCSRLDSSFSDAPLVRCDPFRRTIAAPIAAPRVARHQGAACHSKACDVFVFVFWVAFCFGSAAGVPK